MRLNTRTTASYSFQNAFFYLQWGDDDTVYETNDAVATNLVTLKKTRRRSKLHPHKQRSKYICRPELVVEAGNHFVWEFIPGKTLSIVGFFSCRFMCIWNVISRCCGIIMVILKIIGRCRCIGNAIN